MNTQVDNSTKPVRIRGKEELQELLAREPLVLAEFYSRSCPKCDAQEPILGLIAREFDGVVVMVDPGDDLELVREFGVASMPGFVRFVDEEPMATLAEGVILAAELLAFASDTHE